MHRSPARFPTCLTLLWLLNGTALAEDPTVAYIGDQGVNPAARAVLQLVLDEGTDLLVLQGDLGYGYAADGWIEMMEEALPSEFPVLSVAGNHDRQEWDEYQQWLERRIETSDGLQCSGDVGVKAHCRYDGLSIVQTAPGVREVSPLGPDDDYAGYIRERFENDPARWRICSFHKNQRRMQTGSKGDETGWGVYQACGDTGAMIVTGHEHAYSRTWLLSDFETQEVVHREHRMTLTEGHSIAIVSGLGGKEVRGQERGGDWWASIYTADQGARAGALFCRYGDDEARCEFKGISGDVPDSFTLRSDVGDAAPDGADDIAPVDERPEQAASDDEQEQEQEASADESSDEQPVEQSSDDEPSTMSGGPEEDVPADDRIDEEPLDDEPQDDDRPDAASLEDDSLDEDLLDAGLPDDDSTDVPSDPAPAGGRDQDEANGPVTPVSGARPRPAADTTADTVADAAAGTAVDVSPDVTSEADDRDPPAVPDDEGGGGSLVWWSLFGLGGIGWSRARGCGHRVSRPAGRRIRRLLIRGPEALRRQVACRPAGDTGRPVG